LNMLRTTRPFFAVLLIVGFWAADAWSLDGQTKSTVRALALEAQSDFDSGRYAEAIKKYEQALSVLPVPTLCVFAARAYARTGKLVQAAELYRRAIRLSRTEDWVGDGQERAQHDASIELSAILPRLSRLRLQLKGDRASLRVSINGVAVPDALIDAVQVVDPGTCIVVVSRNGQQREARLQLREGEFRDWDWGEDASNSDMQRVATPKAQSGVIATGKPNSAGNGPNAHPIRLHAALGWTSSALGAAGLLTGITAGTIVAIQSHRYDCDGGCTVEQASDAELANYNRWRTVSTVGFIAGAALAATGITLILTEPNTSSSLSVGLNALPGMASIKGNF
jgi:hypothetical protein